MLERLLTEQRNERTQEIDRLSAFEMVKRMAEEDRRCAEAVESAASAIAAVVERVAATLESGGRLFYIGAGTSGRLGVLDASEWIPTFNVEPGTCIGIIAGGPDALVRPTEASEDRPEAGAADLEAHGFTGRDMLIGIAASGRTPYVLGAIRQARAMGAVTAGISCTPDAELSQTVELAIEVLAGPEVLTGSTRMKAGTVTKMVLNILSTGAMIRLGYTFGNLMVNVQPKNEKLVDRAQRIVMEASGVSRDRANELFEAAGRNVKTAIVMARLQCDVRQAEERLRAAGGRVSEALKD
jgi:N-acetylmuramic acid 6-phosphate etherase